MFLRRITLIWQDGPLEIQKDVYNWLFSPIVQFGEMSNLAKSLRFPTFMVSQLVKHLNSSSGRLKPRLKDSFGQFYTYIRLYGFFCSTRMMPGSETTRWDPVKVNYEVSKRFAAKRKKSSTKRFFFRAANRKVFATERFSSRTNFFRWKAAVDHFSEIR